MTERVKRYRSENIYPVSAAGAVSEITILANKWGVNLDKMNISGSEDGELYISTYDSWETNAEMEARIKGAKERAEADAKREKEMYALLKKKYGDDGSS